MGHIPISIGIFRLEKRFDISGLRGITIFV